MLNIIVVSRRNGRVRSISSGVFIALVVIGLSFLGATGYLGYWLGHQSQNDVFDQNSAAAWKKTLAKQKEEISQVKQYSEEQIQALTVKIAELQARATRVDALGDRLVKVAKLDEGEFDFSEPPAVGGPEASDLYSAAYQVPVLTDVIDDLATRIEGREEQLTILESLLSNRKISNDTFIAGRPILKGWMSSRYGYRSDPFTGKMAWHEGVDFAGKEGSDIVAVAAGVVTWASERYGYGLMVEINHGNGYSTRYGHSKELLVKVGDVVKKGQVIARMGSTGRSTGPHVHFEVHNNGKALDPAKFILRASK